MKNPTANLAADWPEEIPTTITRQAAAVRPLPSTLADPAPARTAFKAAALLTEGMKETAGALRRCRRGSEARRRAKHLLLSQAFYRDLFLQKAVRP